MWETGPRTHPICKSNKVESRAAGGVQLFALGAALASEMPSSTSAGQKGRLFKTPLMRNISSK